MSVSGFETLVSECPLKWRPPSTIVVVAVKRKSQVLLVTVLTIFIVSLAPVSAIFAGLGQAPTSRTAEELLRIVQMARQQVKILIDSVYANDPILQNITQAGLLNALQGNSSLYDQGETTLAKAQNSFDNGNYSETIDYSRESLQSLRDVFKSINIILNKADVQISVFDGSNILEAMNRSLVKITRLRELLPDSATDMFALLDQAEKLLDLNGAETLILNGKVDEATDNLLEANQLISQVYQYLKLEAEEFIPIRINGYLQEMEQARERIRERLRYAGSEGVDVTSILTSLGYINEADFLMALQNMTQAIQGQIGNMSSVMQDLQAISQMTQQMNQTLNQEISRHQERYGAGGNSASNGSGNGSTSPSGAGTSGSGSGGTGTDSGAGITSGTGTPGSSSTPGTGGSGGATTSGGGNAAGSNGPTSTSGSPTSGTGGAGSCSGNGGSP